MLRRISSSVSTNEPALCSKRSMEGMPFARLVQPVPGMAYASPGNPVISRVLRR